MRHEYTCCVTVYQDFVLDFDIEYTRDGKRHHGTLPATIRRHSDSLMEFCYDHHVQEFYEVWVNPIAGYIQTFYGYDYWPLYDQHPEMVQTRISQIRYDFRVSRAPVSRRD